MVTTASRTTIANAMGSTLPKAPMPPRARMNRMASVAYDVEDNASEEKMARPTVLLTRSCGASAVESGRPMSQRRQFFRGGGATRTTGPSGVGTSLSEGARLGEDTKGDV